MPRNLPWKAAAAPAAAVSSSPSTKRIQSSPRRADPKDDEVSSSSKQPKRRKRRRSESASPPPIPPSEEFMNSGVSADDAYIMVEDEFLATARTFTAPLHHAEYKRQKALARARKHASSPSMADIGSSAAMSAALRRQKASAGSLARGRAALESVGVMKSKDDDDGGSDSSSSDFAAYFGEHSDGGPEIEKRASPPRADDPWLGTSLAPLLTPRKRRAEAHLAAPPSLVGLHGVRSDTRAARGYGASDAADLQPRSRREFDLPPPPPSKAAVRSAASPGSASETEGDSDDLDAPAKSRSTAQKKIDLGAAQRSTTESRREHRRLPSPPPRTAAMAKRETLTSPSSSPSKVRQKPWLMKDGKGTAQTKTAKAGKGLDVNEIPTFLV